MSSTYILVGAGVSSPIAPPVAEATTSPPPAKLLVSARDAADLLSISERTLWGLTAPRGPIPVVRCGRAVRYSVGDLHVWIDAAREVAR